MRRDNVFKKMEAITEEDGSWVRDKVGEASDGFEEGSLEEEDLVLCKRSKLYCLSCVHVKGEIKRMCLSAADADDYIAII